MAADTKTIHEFLAENPNVDVMKAWERCWSILSNIQDKVASAYPKLERHPSTDDRQYYQSPNKEWEGSFSAYTGEGMEWLVHSWLGNRNNSILDMNVTAFLSQDIDVPHLVMVFGTIPSLFCYCDLIPRSSLLTDVNYLDKYYNQELNQEFLKFRGNSQFQWSVSHGTYMRAMTSPMAISMTADLSNETIDVAGSFYERITDHWLNWVQEATPVSSEKRAALRAYDHKVRELAYQRDPMNALAEKVFGKDEVASMVEMRMGREQMRAVK